MQREKKRKRGEKRKKQRWIETGTETDKGTGVTGTETEKPRSGQTPCNYPSG